MSSYKLGDKIGWYMFDGSIMCGTVTYLGFSSIDVQRIDGGLCFIKDTKESWLADYADMEQAIGFFQAMGK